jgi:quinol-cytochrome oxidoreductase complex cytochrome b subunit
MKRGNTVKQSGFIGKLDEMFPFDWDILREAGAEPVPHHLKKWWFCLGGTVLYLFIIQIVTGIALSFYYVPFPEEAYQSVTRITQEVRFGWFIRSLHRWASNFLIFALILHMLRIYFTGAYRHPRQINWIIGSLLLFLALSFGFTGYSLVFEQQSYWGATVAANLTEAVPLVGPTLASFMRGGPEIGVNTLTRFHILHIGLLPTLSFILIVLHIFLIRLHGVTELYFEGEVIPKEKKFFRFFPDHVITELIIGMILLYLLTILALIYPIGLGPPADPNVTPEHIKPEWYFYFNFRLLKLTSLNVLFLSMLFFGLTVLFWPFIEELLQKKFKLPEFVSVIIGIVCFLILVIFTVWESFST